MSGWVLKVRISEDEKHVLAAAAGHLRVTVPQLLSQGAGAYASLCGFWGDGIPVEVRVSPYWDRPARGPMTHTVDVPFAREDLRRIGRACDYVRAVCGDLLVPVPLGEFIVGSTLRALRQWRAFRVQLVGIDLPTLDEPIVFSGQPLPAPECSPVLSSGEVTR